MQEEVVLPILWVIPVIVGIVALIIGFVVGIMLGLEYILKALYNRITKNWKDG